jgi:hypothetical protein
VNEPCERDVQLDLANFKYGQKRGFLVWDDVSWFGEGDAIVTAEAPPAPSD